MLVYQRVYQPNRLRIANPKVAMMFGQQIAAHIEDEEKLIRRISRMCHPWLWPIGSKN